MPAARGAIEDLDPIVEVPPVWPRRWLLPIAGAVLLAAVLTITFVKVPTLRPSILGGPPAGSMFRVLELPPGTATFQTRVVLSGVTGLTSASQSDGYRYLYRLPDGRSVVFLEFPARESGITLDRVVAPAGLTKQALPARGVPGVILLPVDSAGATGTAMLIWIADGTFYQLSTSATDAVELARLAAALR